MTRSIVTLRIYSSIKYTALFGPKQCGPASVGIHMIQHAIHGVVDKISYIPIIEDASTRSWRQPVVKDVGPEKLIAAEIFNGNGRNVYPG